MTELKAVLMHRDDMSAEEAADTIFAIRQRTDLNPITFSILSEHAAAHRERHRMNAIPATPAALAGLFRAKTTAENELQTMRRVNHAFTKGRRAFIRRGFAAADFERFTDTIRQYSEYGAVPFSPRLLLSKMTQIERIKKQIAVGQAFLTPAKAG